ncbi:MAG: hypothetical protein ACRELV_11930 [Longimicrobiales bacterium]
MLRTRPLTGLRLPEAIKRRLEVAVATASEALIETHVEFGVRFVLLMRDQMPFDQAVDRYIEEMDLTGTAATTARTRILVGLEEAERGGPEIENGTGPGAGVGRGGWGRFRPGRVVRDIRDRQRRLEELDTLLQLALAQAEDGIIATHIDNALDFVALLDEHMSMERAVENYLGEIGLSGCRAQTVLQRTMSRLADAQLPELPFPGLARGARSGG